MPCYHPIKAFYKINKITGKKEFKFASQIDSSVSLSASTAYPYPIDIPCGQCIGCRLEYSRQWAVRCCLESALFEHNYFVTLTYADEFLPISRSSDHFTLSCNHLKKFFKDLRRYFSYHFDHIGIRFYASGEYGSSTLRPHYHAIIFNLPLPDLKFYKKSFDGHAYFTSEILDKIWSKGYVVIANFSFSTAAYVARYVVSKQTGKNASFYTENGIEPPFSRCSRRPGIGRFYYDVHKDHFYSFDQIVITNSKGVALKIKPPRYYDRLYDFDDPDQLFELKERRRLSGIYSRKNVMQHTDLARDEYLAVAENNKNSSIKSLLRPL